MGTASRISAASLLTGTEEVAVDDKGRLVMNRAKRAALGDSFSMGFDFNSRLAAFPDRTVEEMVALIYSAPANDEARLILERMVIGTMETGMKFDAQGRVVIPQTLRADAGLVKEAVLVGCGDRVEVWPKDEYYEYRASVKLLHGSSRREVVEWAYDRIRSRTQAQEGGG